MSFLPVFRTHCCRSRSVAYLRKVWMLFVRNELKCWRVTGKYVKYSLKVSLIVSCSGWQLAWFVQSFLTRFHCHVSWEWNVRLFALIYEWFVGHGNHTMVDACFVLYPQHVYCEWWDVYPKCHDRGDSASVRCTSPNPLQQPSAHFVCHPTGNALCVLPAVRHESGVVSEVWFTPHYNIYSAFNLNLCIVPKPFCLSQDKDLRNIGEHKEDVGMEHFVISLCFLQVPPRQRLEFWTSRTDFYRP